MFFKQPNTNDAWGNTQEPILKDWVRDYQCLYDNVIYNVVVTITYIHPTYEMFNIDLDYTKDFGDLRVVDYVKQMVSQQSMQDYMIYAEKGKLSCPSTTGGTVDSWFDEEEDV